MYRGRKLKLQFSEILMIHPKMPRVRAGRGAAKAVQTQVKVEDTTEKQKKYTAKKQPKSVIPKEEPESEEVQISTVDENTVRIEYNPVIFGKAIHQEWSKLYNNDLFSDFVIIIGSERIKAHKFVLGCWSPEWREIIAKSKKNEVELGSNEEERRYLKIMIEFQYKGTVSLQSQDIMGVLSTAHKYGVSALKEQCGLLLFECAEVKNVAFFLDIAQKYGCSLLETCCANYMATEFDELSKQDSLFTLPLTTWRELLKSEEVKVRSERDLYEAAMKYIELQDPSKQMDMYNELLPCIRFPFMSTKYLIDKVEPLEDKIPILRELLYETFKYKAYPQDKSGLHPLRSHPRRGLIFTWSKDRTSSGLKVDEDTGFVEHIGRANTWQTVCGSEFVSSGYHTWSVKIHANLSNWLFIGVVSKAWRGYQDQSSGYVGYQANSWSYGSYPGWGKTTGGSGGQYGISYKTGDTVTIILDMDEKTLSFAINGTDQGVCFRNMNADELCPAVTLYQTGDKISIAEI